MSTRDNNPGNASGGASHGQQSVGNLTSGEQGATPGHETMAETGGSGGPALTQPRREETAPSARTDNRQSEAVKPAEGAGTAATAITRGYQDTRSRQASPGSTGLGEPETGGNQDESDLAPPR